MGQVTTVACNSRHSITWKGTCEDASVNSLNNYVRLSTVDKVLFNISFKRK